MYRTILVSDVNNERLNRLLEKVGMVLSPLSQDGCLDELQSAGADFVIVVQDADGRGVEFALKCSALSDATVVFVTRFRLPDALVGKLVSGGVCVLSAPDVGRAEEFSHSWFPSGRLTTRSAARTNDCAARCARRRRWDARSVCLSKDGT